MAGTIFPIVYGAPHDSRFQKVILVHCCGYVVGAATLGMVVGGFGAVFRKGPLQNLSSESALLLAIGLACLLLGAREMSLCSFPIPQSKWQVPRKWRRLPLHLMSFTYAFVLGLGVLTRISTGLFLVMIVWIFLKGEVFWGAAVASGFGIGRALPFALASKLKVLRTEAFMDIVSASGAALQLTSGLFLSAAGGVLLVASAVR